MINKITLKFGSDPNTQPLNLDVTPVTVFVGPNNSGKSKILAEIKRYCFQGTRVSSDLLIDKIIFKEHSTEEAEKIIDSYIIPHNQDDNVLEGNVLVGKLGARNHINRDQLLHAIQNANRKPSHFCPWFLQFNTLILDSKKRTELTNEQKGTDLLKPPKNTFQLLFCDEEKKNELRRIIHEAFGKYLVIDPSNLGNLRIRLSERKPLSQKDERGFHEDALDFLKEATDISQTSDGVKAFTGILTEIIAGDPKILLIDEPEAFLHPSLAYKLGKELAVSSASSDKSIFVSTHSANFVMGCIQSGVPINIVRLTYDGELATARVLKKDEIIPLMRNPLLRSTGVLEGIFYDYVIVTEGDTDRAFYQEINERLLSFKPEWGIPNCLFLNAQNKQTVHTIIQPLRKLGIPAAGIVDIDIIKNGGTDWTNFLKSGFLPEMEHSPLSLIRAKIKEELENTGRNMKREGGLELLNDQEKEAANNLFDQLEKYGLFALRNGEIESWLKHLNSGGHGSRWLINIFEKIGEDPESSGYLKPADDDVWEFLSRIKNWFYDREKKGIPS